MLHTLVAHLGPPHPVSHEHVIDVALCSHVPCPEQPEVPLQKGVMHLGPLQPSAHLQTPPEQKQSGHKCALQSKALAQPGPGDELTIATVNVIPSMGVSSSDEFLIVAVSECDETSLESLPDLTEHRHPAKDATVCTPSAPRHDVPALLPLQLGAFAGRSRVLGSVARCAGPRPGRGPPQLHSINDHPPLARCPVACVTEDPLSRGGLGYCARQPPHVTCVR
jgi:hypothetical protein